MTEFLRVLRNHSFDNFPSQIKYFEINEVHKIIEYA